MPLKLIAPRNARTKNLYIRGSYLGVHVDKSSGSDKRAVARAILKRLCEQIERGEYPPREEITAHREPTFIAAAINYIETGHPRRYLAPLISYFGEAPLAAIGQEAIDEAAAKLYPTATAVTRNAYVYTPVSAVLHHAGVEITIRRPKGFAGRTITDWLTPADAAAIIAAAESFDPEFATLLTFLLYTGSRIGAALELRREDVRLEEGRAWARSQKGQPHMDIRLHPDLCDKLAALLATDQRTRVFRFHYGAHLGHQLTRSRLACLGLPCPRRCPIGWKEPPNRLAWVTFHSFRHTWATWMRQAGTDLQGLVATGNWRSERSARRYAHAVPRDEWDRVDKLPSVGKIRGVGSS
jgi:integrase